MELVDKLRSRSESETCWWQAQTQSQWVERKLRGQLEAWSPAFYGRRLRTARTTQDLNGDEPQAGHVSSGEGASVSYLGPAPARPAPRPTTRPP